MKQYELKDLEAGNEYIVAYRNDDRWIPCIVKIVKEYTVKFVRPKDQMYSPLEFNKEYKLSNFCHEHRGIDLFENKFRMLLTFENYGIAKAWCDFQNSINEYIEDNGTEF